MTVRHDSNTLAVVFAAMLVWALCAPAAATGRTITVDDDGAAEFKSIQAAIDDANDGDEIIVEIGTYVEAIDFSGKAITLRSFDPNDPTVVAKTIIDPTYLNEDFDDGDYNGWKVEMCAPGKGDWAVVNGVMQETAGGYCGSYAGYAKRGTYAWWQGGKDWTDYTIDLKMKSTDNDVIGVMFRYQDDDNYYRFYWNRQTPGYCLTKHKEDSATPLALGSAIAYAADTWYDIKIVASGPNLKLFINGELKLEASDSDFDKGSIALYSCGNSGSYFDNVRVSVAGHAVQCVSGEGPDTILDGFTVTGGYACGSFPDDCGAGMYNQDSSPTVTKCTFTGNSADYGGGMANYSSSPTVKDCAFSSNTASLDGGGMYNQINSSPMLTNCTFTSNSAGSAGGAMYNYNNSNLAVNDCNFTDNQVTGSTWGGGGMCNVASEPNVSGCAFRGNSSKGGGGAMYNLESSHPTLTDCNFVDNSSTSGGGAIYNIQSSQKLTRCRFIGNVSDDDAGAVFSYDHGSSEILDCVFTGNKTSDKGGAVYCRTYDNSVIANCIFSDNSGAYGGAIAAWEQCSGQVSECIFEGNQALHHGGAMWNAYGSSPAVAGCRFTNNHAGTWGGAMCNTAYTTYNSSDGKFNNWSNPDVTNCTFSGNSSNGVGGAMGNWYCDPNIVNCKFSENSGGTQGGAVYNEGSLPNLVNSMFVGNSAGTEGGAICNRINSSPTLVNCTFSGNIASSGGGMYTTTDSRPFVSNCIFWGDTPDEIVDNTATGSSTTAVYSNVQGSWPGAFNVDADPLFLGAAGGDLRLGVGSPCVDVGTNTYAGGADLDGKPRIIDGDGDGSAVVDMGTFEADCATAKVPQAFATIQNAIDSARPGTEILIGPGTYNETVNFHGKAVTLRSSDGPQVTIIDATGLGAPAVTCASGEGANTVFEGFTITGGSSSAGGGIYCNGSSPTISDCTLTGNSAVTSGGGIYCGGGSPTLVNCVIYGNSAASGAAISCIDSSPTVTNCTITRNSATTAGGALYCDGSSAPKVTNCVLWADSPAEIHNEGGAPVVSYCDVQGGYSGAGNNIDADPMFANASGGDFSLHKDSPCFNAGNNTAGAIADKDFDGRPRIVFGTVDMGPWELDISSRLTVTIAPQDAVDAGAKWRVAGEGQWRESGSAVYDLPGGYYELELKETPGWTTPDNLSVRVSSDLRVDAQADYRLVPAFDIGQIPPRDVDHGGRLAFYVYSEQLGPGASLEAVADHLPDGPMYFDHESGLFTYEPNDPDRRPLFVTFSATSGADVNEQMVEITPIPDLPPEQTIVSRPVQPYPDPNSPDYVFESAIELQASGEKVLFNCEMRPTRSVTIAGKTVIFEAGLFNGKYGPYDYGKLVADIHDMTICAETLIIASPLHLPQTDVTIYARDLQFQEGGLIDTTPLDYSTPAKNLYDDSDGPVDGNDGHKGGDITLYIESFDPGQSPGPRFVMNGGKGQGPEPGHAGEAGSSVAEVGTTYGSYPGNVIYLVYYRYSKDWLGRCVTDTYYRGNSALFPTPGTDAVPAGKPGSGGDGGDLVSALDLSAYVESIGGQSAEAANGGNDYLGGADGTPNPAYHAIVHHHGCDENLWHWYNCGRPTVPAHQQGKITLVYSARAAASAPAPAADVAQGLEGRSLYRPSALCWLSPYALKMVLAHAKDAYLYGYTAETRDILEEYDELLGSYMGLPQWEGLPEQWRFEFEQMHQEIVTILHRIESDLDYFGNPPNWSPMLSFEVLREAYGDEVNHAIHVLYLVRWIEKKADSIRKKADALQTGRLRLWEQTGQFRTDYEGSRKIIPSLEKTAAEIALKIGDENSGLLRDLKRKEAELIERARKNVHERNKLPWWKKAMRLSGAVLKQVTMAENYGKPGKVWEGSFAALGATLYELPGMIYEPWPQISSQSEVVEQFNNAKFDDATAGWLQEFGAEIRLEDIETDGANKYLENLKDSAAQMASGMGGVRDALMTTSLNNEEVEAELKKIKAKDPEFNKFVDEVMELMVQKELFNRQLGAAMQKVTVLSNGITNNLLAIDAMNRDESHANRVLDPRALMYIKDMEKRALERLLKYHYYMAKAYEYRLLEPYEGDLNLHTMFEKIEQIASSNGDLSEDDYEALKVLYEDELRIVTDAILEKYTWGQEKENSKVGQTSLRTAEIEALNRGQEVTVNLFERDMFEARREGLRILDVNVLSVNLAPEPDGAQCPDAYITCYVSHSGLSNVQVAGQTYQFTHPAENIYWDSDCYVSGRIDPPRTSDAQDSLLSVLLGLDPDKIMFYSRPAAWADLTIAKSVTQLGDCSNVRIRELKLGVKYDYKLRDKNLKILLVAAEPNGPDWGLMPYFLVEKADEHGRQDGIGSFRRTYDCRGVDSAKVTAPEVHGCWRFAEWAWTTGAGQPATSSNPTMTVSFDCDTAPDRLAILARYDYEGPPLSPADFDQSAYVDFSDYEALTSAWQAIPGDPRWNDDYDISDTPDNVIDMRDVAAFADNWLTTPQ
ncbi:MAG: DUF1080 domain-containing protein [Phycisphaerales bacterium]|nr:MAG: DUF1080 domain-containing protein [Phycisphaerales bacterium]